MELPPQFMCAVSKALCLNILFSLIHKRLMRFSGPVVKRSSPLIPWHFQPAIVAGKVTMVKLMMKGAQRQNQLTANHDALVASVRSGSRQREVH